MLAERGGGGGVFRDGKGNKGRTRLVHRFKLDTQEEIEEA
jgi:hypothetical protein